MSNNLPIWTIYDHPKDHPDSFVARLWIVELDAKLIIATSDMFVASTLEELRSLLPPGLNRIPRYASDDPIIIEAWL